MPLTRRQFIRQSAAAACISGAGCATHSRQVPTRIVDTHLHLWNLNTQKLPWLKEAPKLLSRSYGLEQYREATAGLSVRAIYMEVDVAEETLSEEAESVLAVAAGGQTPMVAAVLGGRPASVGFKSYVDKFRSNPRFKGVRQVLHGPGTPAGFCLGREFVRGVQALGDAGKSFDLCMRAPELMDGVLLVTACPETRFVLDHCGNPDLKCFAPTRAGEAKPAHTADAWKRSIDALAERPNVICKISGVAAGLPKGGDASYLAPAVNHCLDAFGPDRVVFGGDWPVCLLGASYRKWVDYLQQIVATRSILNQEKLWSGNAIRHYGLSA